MTLRFLSNALHPCSSFAAIHRLGINSCRNNATFLVRHTTRPSLVRHMQSAAEKIDLRRGQPATCLRPAALLKKAFDMHFSSSLQNQLTALQYGNSHEGSIEVRQALATFLSEQYKEEVLPEQLFMTGGASGGIELVASVYGRPPSEPDINSFPIQTEHTAGRFPPICMEDPTYFLANQVFLSQHLGTFSVPVDQHGLRTDMLERALVERQQAHAPRVTCVYTIPDHHNPACVVMSAERRAHLAALARKYKFIIMSDDVYHTLYFEGDRPPQHTIVHHYRQQSLQSTSSSPSSSPSPSSSSAATSTSQAREYPAGVISIGSFSKILAPGLRLGWIHASDPALLQPIKTYGAITSGGAPCQFLGEALRPLIGSQDMRAHVRYARGELGRRASILYTSLRDFCPEGVEVARPTGGYFVWVTVKSVLKPGFYDELARQCAQHAVNYLPGSVCSPHSACTQSARLCFAFLETDAELVEGARRFMSAVRKTIENLKAE